MINEKYVSGASNSIGRREIPTTLIDHVALAQSTLPAGDPQFIAANSNSIRIIEPHLGKSSPCARKRGAPLPKVDVEMKAPRTLERDSVDKVRSSAADEEGVAARGQNDCSQIPVY